MSQAAFSSSNKPFVVLNLCTVSPADVIKGIVTVVRRNVVNEYLDTYVDVKKLPNDEDYNIVLFAHGSGDDDLMDGLRNFVMTRTYLCGEVKKLCKVNSKSIIAILCGSAKLSASTGDLDVQWIPTTFDKITVRDAPAAIIKNMNVSGFNALIYL